MARWEPDAPGRLTAAALDLFAEHGYERTSVADIAERAGVTERTFFRYFADKREVLFDSAHRLEDTVIAAIASSDGSTPLDVMVDAFVSTSELFDDRADFARRRALVIESHASLRERELLKLALLASGARRALCERGVAEPEAAVAAEVAVTVFKVAFGRWIDDASLPLADHVRGVTTSLRTGIQRPSSHPL
ncbi:TetR/AcrR family transcriptional regulator [Gordonia sp. MP11Mi]|uniref:HTH tetR-type domain-containing protein n=1 Tax=Gordonia sp. MP11Mi TaxID=3022769 RepID=A0AA97GVS6_9ACTN